MAKPISALILDRDGTLNAMVLNPKGEQDSPYFGHQLVLYPNLSQLLLPFVEQNIPLFIATNQPGVAKGNFNHQDMAELHQGLLRQLEENGIPIKEIFVCDHHPSGTPSGNKEYIRDCECRKPKAGLFKQMNQKYGIDLSSAIYIGDSLADEQAAEKAEVGNFYPVKTFINSEVPFAQQKVGFPDAQTLEATLQEIKQKFL